MLRGKVLKITQHFIQRSGICAEILNEHLQAGDQLRDHGHQQYCQRDDDQRKCAYDAQPSCSLAAFCSPEDSLLEELDQRIQDISDHDPDENRIHNIVDPPQQLPQ